MSYSSYEQLVKNLGFTADPFAKTNADEEDRLGDYFIKPPFFNAVYGSPRDPKSAIVFAPRGGGKTALKRMIEISSENNTFLCITYNFFDVSDQKLDDIDLNYHLSSLIKLILVAILSCTEDNDVRHLDGNDRHILYIFIKEYLSKLKKEELKNAINSVKNLGDRAQEWWNKLSGPFGILLNLVLKKFDYGEAEIKKIESSNGDLGSLFEQLSALLEIALKFGYDSIYVLVDKVDENALTGKASYSYKFVEPIIGNLQVLEMPKFGFKLFLWDKLLDLYRDTARPDRVKYYQLVWKTDSLKEMLIKRLQAYSESKISAFIDLCDKTPEFVNWHLTHGETIDDLIALFGQGSPRNIIRLCKEILDQQSEINADSSSISMDAITRGFEIFAGNYTNEILTDRIINELKKMRRTDFTVKYLYVNVFKFTQQAGMTKVRTWQDAGAVEQLGVIQETEGAKASNHYGVTNLIFAKHIFQNISIFDFFDQKVSLCPNCKNILIRDWNHGIEYTCHSCQSVVQRR